MMMKQTLRASEHQSLRAVVLIAAALLFSGATPAAAPDGYWGIAKRNGNTWDMKSVAPGTLGTVKYFVQDESGNLKLVAGSGSGSLADGDYGSVTVSGSGSVITIDSGAVTNGMLAGSIAASKLVGTDIATVGTLTAGATGAGFTVALSTSTITGTLAAARLPATAQLTDGTLALAGFGSITGILPPANMGTGSSITTKYLRGDGTWQTIGSGTGDMTAAVYDPQSAGYISGATGSGGSAGGNLQMQGGSAATTAGGGILTRGGSASGAAGGGINMYGGSGTNAAAGILSTYGGTASSAAGGDILTAGGTLPGGHIYTYDGGGSIDTRGTGSIELGASGTRTTLTGTASADRAISLPDASGTLAIISDTAFASSWNGVTTTAPTKNAIYDWAHTFDTDDDGKVNVLDIGVGIPKTDSGGVVSLATAGTDYTTPSSTESPTNKAYDASATGNVLKVKGYIYLTHPHLADGTNATIGTTATSITYGHATFSNSVDQATNYVEYFIQVPEDIDTSVALRARIKVLLGNTDTATQRYVLSSVSVADSAVPGSATLANAINVDFAGDASGASGDVETSAWTTLTSWAGALTAGQTWRIRFARDGDTSDASTVNSTELGLVIEYGVTQ